jgi:beta-galactosidase
MVTRSRNHPCVFMYGLGNEEVSLRTSREAAGIIRTMRREARKLDRYRPVTMALGWRDASGQYENGLAGVHDYDSLIAEMDVASFNGYPEITEEFRAEHPDKPVLISEVETGSWTRDCYQTDTDTARKYIFELSKEEHASGKYWDIFDAARAWSIFSASPSYAGFFIKAGFDYRGDPSPLPYPAVISQKGILDACGFMKDSAWYFMSRWTDEPVLRTFPRWEDIEQSGMPSDIYAFTNLNKVEILAGKRSFGKVMVPESGIVKWENVSFIDSPLHVRGWVGRKNMSDQLGYFSGSAAQIRIEPAVDDIHIGQGDVIVMDLALLDINGKVARHEDDWVSFRVSGAGTFYGCGNGDPGDRDSDKRPHRKCFHGRMQFLIRVTEASGSIKVSASTDKLKTECTIML